MRWSAHSIVKLSPALSSRRLSLRKTAPAKLLGARASWHPGRWSGLVIILQVTAMLRVTSLSNAIRGPDHPGSVRHLDLDALAVVLLRPGGGNRPKGWTGPK